MEHDKNLLRFFCALACQCFINEFVFACSDQEQELAQRLRELLAGAIASNASVPEIWLAAIAAYYPLGSLLRQNYSCSDVWSECRNPIVDSAGPGGGARAAIARLRAEFTAISQGNSLAVRQQYEENPYPRWIKASPVGPPTTLSARLRELCPLIDSRTLLTAETNGNSDRRVWHRSALNRNSPPIQGARAARRRSQPDKLSYACEKRESLV